MIRTWGSNAPTTLSAHLMPPSVLVAMLRKGRNGEEILKILDAIVKVEKEEI